MTKNKLIDIERKLAEIKRLEEEADSYAVKLKDVLEKIDEVRVGISRTLKG